MMVESLLQKRSLDSGGDSTERDVADEDSQRRRVLVIEDDRHDWEIYGKILWYNGFDVLYAGDGETGYAMAERHRPDLILLDVVLPDVNGLEICKRLTQNAKTADIPVIMLSGRSAAEMGAYAEQAGCARYLEKPSRPLDVLHAVEEMIGRAPPAGVGRPPRKFPPGA
jgi:DNA-binding response OmpR family regulator